LGGAAWLKTGASNERRRRAVHSTPATLVTMKPTRGRLFGLEQRTAVSEVHELLEHGSAAIIVVDVRSTKA
jgi:hypothetical protein